MSDALADFVMTGKLDFKSLTQSMIAELIKVEMRMMLFGGGGGIGLFAMIGSLFTGVPASGTGGMVTASGVTARGQHESRQGYARGGMVPINAHAGEGIFTPRQMDNADKLLRQGMQQGVSVSTSYSPKININVQTQPGQTAKVGKQTQGANGDMSLDIIIEAVEENMTKNIHSGRGISPALEKQYGLDRSSRNAF